MQHLRAAWLAIIVVLGAAGVDARHSRISAEPAQPEVLIETGRLTPDEESTLQRIKGLYEDFIFGPDVRRYSSVDPETGNKIHLRNELVLKKADGLIAGQYASYEVTFDADVNVVNYWFDAGTAFRGWGTVLVSEKTVTRSQWSCGMSACSLLVQVNGKTVYDSD